MKEDWKINIGGCFCFVGKRESGESEVFFASPNKKTKAKSVIKLVESACLQNFIELWIDNYEEFKLKIGPSTTIFAKHPNFPEPEKWYPVKNWMLQETDYAKRDQLSDYIVNSSIIKGELDGVWTPLFNTNFDASVNFISKNMPEWGEKEEEILRRINFETGKKTTKWIPGHRYDSENSTFWYLGDVISRISNRGKTKDESWYWGDDQTKLETSSGEKVSCFLTKSPINAENLWENVVISMNREKKDLNYFDILIKKPKVVDSGEWIDSVEKIWDNPREWRIGMVNRILKDICLKQTHLIDGIVREEYFNLHYALEPLYLYLGEKDTTSLKEIGEYINPILTPIIIKCFEDILSYHGYEQFELVEDIEKRTDKINYLVDTFITNYIRELFCGKKTLIKELFSSLDNSLFDLAEKFLENFSITDRLNSWKNYLSNIRYIQNSPKYSNRYFDLRKRPKENVLYRMGINSDKVTEIVEKSLSDEDISKDTKNLIVDMIKWSKENNNLGLTKFWINKYNEVEIVITLQDVLNRYHILEEKEIPENYKYGIMFDRMWKFTIYADVNIDWDSQ